MSATLALLAGVIGVLPRTTGSPIMGAVLVGAVGLLVYGPYSLLSGVLAVESGGAQLAATAAGVIDGVGYLAAILAGAALGRMLDLGGYTLGFGILSAVTAVSACAGPGASISRTHSSLVRMKRAAQVARS